MNSSGYIVWFADMHTDATSQIGKAGKHIGGLVQAGFPVLPGFVITSDAYFAFLQQKKLADRIKKLLTTINYERPETIHQVMEHIKKIVRATPLPDDVIKELKTFYARLEDFPLNVHAHSTTPLAHKIADHKAHTFEDLVESIKQAWAEQFEPNMHWKRHEHGHDHLQTGVELIVQVAIDPEMKGKIYTVDPHDHAKNTLHITHQHSHGSDAYTISKKSLMILDRQLNHHAKAPKLIHEELLAIASLGKEIEKHLYFPQEITWGILENALFLLHTKPLSTLPKAKIELKKKLAHIRGIGITPTIGSGTVRIIDELSPIHKTLSHDIVVLKHITKEQIKHLKKVRGIISETGNKHSEVSALVRQLGIPTLFGVKDATKRLKNGHLITIHGGRGEVYRGGFH